MKIKVVEFVGEVNKLREILNYEFSINSKIPGFKKQFFKERDKTLKKYLEMKEKIKWEYIKKLKYL